MFINTFNLTKLFWPPPFTTENFLVPPFWQLKTFLAPLHFAQPPPPRKYLWTLPLGPRYWNVPVLLNTGTFLVYQYCPKMWYIHPFNMPVLSWSLQYWNTKWSSIVQYLCTSIWDLKYTSPPPFCLITSHILIFTCLIPLSCYFHTLHNIFCIINFPNFSSLW